MSVRKLTALVAQTILGNRAEGDLPQGFMASGPDSLFAGSIREFISHLIPLGLFCSVSNSSNRHQACYTIDIMEIKTVRMQIPENANLILGQTHFIKSAEDLYEIMMGSVPGIRFAVAFNEASGPCLIRVEGNDDDLRKAAIANAQAIGAGHIFVILLRQAFPINMLGRIKNCPEVCSIFCATANPVEVIIAESEQGRGILGVIDGSSPKGVEGSQEVKHRREFLRKIGYKL
jgi:adenosine/AMP kinase